MTLDRIKYWVATFLAGAIAGCGAMVLAQPDPLSQEAFPCQEDQVLTYSPQFGYDMVGCIHHENIQ